MHRYILGCFGIHNKISQDIVDDQKDSEPKTLVNNFTPPSDGSKLGETNKKGRDLVRACKNGNFNQVQILIQESPESLHFIGMWGNSPLIYACQYNHTNIALLLIDNGAPVGIRNEENCTAMLHVCLHGNIVLAAKMIRLNTFWECGLVYNSETDEKTNLSPLNAACTNGHASVVDLLFGSDLNLNELDIIASVCSAVIHGKSDALSVIMKSKPDIVPYTLAQNGHLLIMTCYSKHWDLVKILLGIQNIQTSYCSCLDKNASVHSSPLSLVCAADQVLMAQLLLDKGADASYSCGKCSPPLMDACRSQSIECSRLLIQFGAKIDFLDPLSGMTPLEFAQNLNLSELVSILNV